MGFALKREVPGVTPSGMQTTKQGGALATLNSALKGLTALPPSFLPWGMRESEIATNLSTFAQM